MTDTIKTYLIYSLAALLVATGAGWTAHSMYLNFKIAQQGLVIAKHEGTILQLSTSLTTAEDANKALTKSVEAQNDQIDTLISQGNDRAAAAQDAIAKAKADGAQWQKKYRAILDKPPANADDECGSLELRLNQYLELRGES